MATPLYEIRRRVRVRLLEPYALVTPGAPNVSPQGTPGTATVSYRVSAVNATGESRASQAKTIATSADTLGVVDFNQLTWTPVQGATSYNIYRTDVGTLVAPLTTGLIGTATAALFDDVGLPGDSNDAPDVNASGLESPFWDDDDLLQDIIDGAKDLWKAIVDLHRNHFATIDVTTMSLASGADEIATVPADCFRILSIEPRDLTDTGSFRSVVFRPKPYQSTTFSNARSYGTVDATGYPIWYDLINAGSPVAAPSIKTAPRVNATIPLRVTYVHTLPTLAEDDNNPIPGESDNALIAWAVAYGRAREREDRMPDPAWLSIYATDKQGLLTVLTPRQEQEVEIVEDQFAGDMWN